LDGFDSSQASTHPTEPLRTVFRVLVDVEVLAIERMAALALGLAGVLETHADQLSTARGVHRS
jgi:hypothetical protein